MEKSSFETDCKFLCIKTLITGRLIDFEYGKIYNGRLTNIPVINIFKNDDFTCGFGFSLGERSGYSWEFKDYFVTLAEYREQRINDIFS